MWSLLPRCFNDLMPTQIGNMHVHSCAEHGPQPTASLMAANSNKVNTSSMCLLIQQYARAWQKAEIKPQGEMGEWVSSNGLLRQLQHFSSSHVCHGVLRYMFLIIGEVLNDKLGSHKI